MTDGLTIPNDSMKVHRSPVDFSGVLGKNSNSNISFEKIKKALLFNQESAKVPVPHHNTGSIMGANGYGYADTSVAGASTNI